MKKFIDGHIIEYLIIGGVIVIFTPTILNLINTSGLNPIEAIFISVMYALFLSFGAVYLLAEYVFKK